MNTTAALTTTTAPIAYGVFADDTLDATFHDKASAAAHTKEMKRDGYEMRTIALSGHGAEDALDFISREVFGMMRTLSPKVKTNICATFSVQFI